MKLWAELTKGVIRENPLLRLALGMCPSLAVTTAAVNGLGMGVAATVVLIGSNVVLSIIRKWVPNEVRIPIFIVVIASFVTVIDMAMAAYFYELHKVLGLFVPLIIVNCIILGRAEAFASKNSLIYSLADAVGMGLGFTLALVVLGSVREVLGNGTIFGVSVFASGFEPVLIMLLPPGAFLALGLLVGLVNRLTERQA